jgi:YHS domain-containing protein
MIYKVYLKLKIMPYCTIIKSKLVKMKKIITLVICLGLFACKSSESSKSDSIYADEVVLVVNYELENMTLEEHADLGKAVAPNFNSKDIPGFIGKSFIGAVDKELFGGVYYFSSEESVESFLESDLWKGVVAHPNLVNFTTNIYNAFDGTEQANGLHTSRKKSNKIEDTDGLHILVVNYNYVEPPSDEKMSSDVKQYAPVFNNENFPGMIGKTMINNRNKKIYGGVYYFTSRDAIDNYFESELWTGFEGDKNTDVYMKDIYSVASISAISNGVPVL